MANGNGDINHLSSEFGGNQIWLNRWMTRSDEMTNWETLQNAEGFH